MHFEELWEQCERLHQEASDQRVPIANLMEVLSLKMTLYQAIDARAELSEEDRQNAKSRTLGEILLTLTHLSLQDNINVFQALATALQYRGIAHFSRKY
jgi:hypothetical protein